jgi:hypothetical protein
MKVVAKWWNITQRWKQWNLINGIQRCTCCFVFTSDGLRPVGMPHVGYEFWLISRETAAPFVSVCRTQRLSAPPPQRNTWLSRAHKNYFATNGRCSRTNQRHTLGQPDVLSWLFTLQSKRRDIETRPIWNHAKFLADFSYILYTTRVYRCYSYTHTFL